ncbi:uncharacterized protein [Dermacentor albipictus]|uniref:uncharacterized protein isoform X1 n=1 Tax=Dermacentor albipictus TaxID=60249 RepID=UPI0038FC730F
MAAHAGPPGFDETEDSWDAYQVRLQSYFEAYDIVDSKKRRALLTAALSTATVGIITVRCAPAKIQDLTYEKLLELLAEHFAPQGNEIAESYKFFTRCQRPDESTKDFIVEIRKKACSCNFGEARDRMLRDRLVCGLRDAGVRRKLLARPSLTLKEVEDIALAAEMAALNVDHMESTQDYGDVHAVRSKVQGQPYYHKSHPSTSRPSEDVVCPCCGSTKHKAAKCKFRRAECFRCRRKGHLAKMCVWKQRVALCEKHSSESDGNELCLMSLYTTSVNLVKPVVRTLCWSGIPLTMQVDTGSPVSIITWKTYCKHRNAWPAIRETSLKLSCFLGKLPVRGQLKLPVSYAGKTLDATLTVLQCDGPNLCGRDVISAFERSGRPVLSILGEETSGEQNVPDSTLVSALLEEFGDLFTPGLGLIDGPAVHLRLRENALPRFCKARSVPYAMREQVSNEIDRLVKHGILSPVDSAEWATPLVPVIKKNGSIRLCGDFKVTANAACVTEQYPLPKIRDIFANLNGGEVFSTIDLKDAYSQLPLDEETKKILVVNTPKGLFCFNRLPFGVASAPAIFQRRMDGILQGIPGIQVYLDDVVVAEKRGNCETLREVFRRFRQHGVKLNPQKCKFRQAEVEFLGHRINTNGLLPKMDNIAAIMEMPKPTGVAELRAFLGFVTYYHSFLGNLATVLEPLHELLRKNTRWQWGARQDNAFRATKRLLEEAKFLAHYDPSKPLILETDASSCGVGAVLYHRVNGQDRPIGFRSRTLSAAERNYSQIEREALAVVFGVTKFREYLLGNHFTLVTDHKPLLSLFSPDKPVPAMAAARIQRWSLLLSAYNYKIQFKPGKTLIPADTLSRLPVRQEHNNTKAAEDDARACNSGQPLSKDVWFKNYGVGDKWKPGSLESTEGSRMATVKTADGEQHRRHLDQLKTRRTSVGGEEMEPEAPVQAATTKGSQNAAADSVSRTRQQSQSGSSRHRHSNAVRRAGRSRGCYQRAASD